MSRLLVADVRPGVPIAQWGEEICAHLARKAHPQLLAASRTAWALLSYGLKELGFASLPDVRFGAQGKPEFDQGFPFFSISHSGALAAVLISGESCGVDIEQLRPEVSARLYARCLTAQERKQDLEFFECWTKKECIGKMRGDGIGTHPQRLDTLDSTWADQFRCFHLSDASGQEYVLSALCKDAFALNYTKIAPEALL